MPRDIATGGKAPIGLGDLVEWLDGPDFDPSDEDGFVAAGPKLAALGADRGFLARIAIAELKNRCRDQTYGNRYGAQVLLLHRGSGKYFIRANLWPAATDPVVRTSGVAPFFYGVAHDHNFSFLTHGYSGPGYWSDYWEHAPGAAVGLAGEPAALTFAGRSRLWQGRTMLYRAHRDVHCQLPADRLSVSLNIMAASPTLPWRDQYRFDPARGTIDGIITTSATEALLAVSTHLGDPDGVDLATAFARRHPSARVRASARFTLADAAPDPAEREAVLARGVDDPDALVSGRCRAALDRSVAVQTPLPETRAAG